MTELASRILLVNSHHEATSGARWTLAMYVVYDRPRDFPTEVVCRRHCLLRDGRVKVDPMLFCRGESIEAVRRKLPRSVECIGREPGDDPNIVEIWV